MKKATKVRVYNNKLKKEEKQYKVTFFSQSFTDSGSIKEGYESFVTTNASRVEWYKAHANQSLSDGSYIGEVNVVEL